ncbi:MAG: gas vesicle protein GvpG [Candidatus Brocadiales bacterium]|nr:gas vesicle protein GvpG [Candidatus Brocadiales bacterium]
MFLVDDILLSPIKFPIFVFKKIGEAVQEELTDKDKITSQLRELYLLVEAGKIAEEEFERKEAELLDKLEAIEEYEESLCGDEEDEEEDYEEDELEQPEEAENVRYDSSGGEPGKEEQNNT